MRSSALLSVTLLLLGLGVTASASAPDDAWSSARSAISLLDQPASLVPCDTLLAPCPSALSGRRAPHLLLASDSAEQLEQELMQLQPEQAYLLAPAAAPVPEPQTLAMTLVGLLLLGFASARRQASEKFGA